ncbi:RNA-binding transcriptional accessory protein [Tepidimonas taiwanensis]|uniref:30S ribosomal protein S1 n=2 Tax=Betaproteobacteria TaxID=28216 RepID=A0A554X9E1_9BURK|nr:Tex family protein [Tepidimonas taiwanensis]MDM7462441.1 Tex family protein [Tepidimonas taiwanensis]TSE32438.1 30S ribosomal protein S1 [Tepidimonas taiwanensis]UBQ06615.1 RNA-binding transcriptional accessory protein [Tepidimonas taiwanensis]
MTTIIQRIADELGVRAAQVQAAVDLLDGGATVPFIARYRKEATGGLDDAQLRQLEQRLLYLRELEERRATILRSIEEQGKLTPALRAAIEAAATKQDLEDLYLPYKPKRRTKAQIAREAGLEPLADALWADPTLDPQVAAQPYVKPAVGEDGSDFTTVAAVLDGARDILAERWAEDAALVQPMREWLWREGLLRSRRIESRNPDDPEVAKFRDYFEHDEPIARVPSHRALAMFRGRAQEILDLRLVQPQEAPPGQPSLAEGRLAQLLGWSHQGRAADDWLRRCVAWTWRVKLSLSIERELFARLREAAEAVAIQVFGANVRDLLLAAPAGARPTMGLDPGIRTGVKVAVVDATGKVVDTATVYPFEPRRDVEGALATLAALVQRHQVELIAIGNGTASRETDRLVAELLQRLRAAGASLVPQKVVVSEAGASVYSASELASAELPELDVSLRGAVSIARRLQDPLAELVKIDPKSIGVGQYQHDVDQTALARTLDAVVEDCVNAVGVDLNTASAPLLARVSGLTPTTARAVVRWRDANGAFRSRQQLLQVTGIGPKTFEQCAGFLRIRGGEQPLDMTGVHPEAYPVVERILRAAGQPIEAVMGKPDVLRRLRPEDYTDERFGVPTVRDILAELEKPGRDPRPAFRVARFDDAVQAIEDLRPGMVLEGTVTNVAQFGAFVDIGVHQDGLVHVSQLANRYVADAREVVKAGDIVRVKVLEVDVPRRRIGLSMRLDAQPGPATGRSAVPAGRGPGRAREAAPAPATAMASAFAKLQGWRS